MDVRARILMTSFGIVDVQDFVPDVVQGGQPGSRNDFKPGRGTHLFLSLPMQRSTFAMIQSVPPGSCDAASLRLPPGPPLPDADLAGGLNATGLPSRRGSCAWRMSRRSFLVSGLPDGPIPGVETAERGVPAAAPNEADSGCAPSCKEADAADVDDAADAFSAFCCEREPERERLSDMSGGAGEPCLEPAPAPAPPLAALLAGSELGAGEELSRRRFLRLLRRLDSGTFTLEWEGISARKSFPTVGSEGTDFAKVLVSAAPAGYQATPWLRRLA